MYFQIHNTTLQIPFFKKFKNYFKNLKEAILDFIWRMTHTYHIGHSLIKGPTLSVTIFLRKSKLVIWNVFVKFFS